MKQAQASQGKIHAKEKRKGTRKKFLTVGQELGIMSSSRVSNCSLLIHMLTMIFMINH